MLIDIEKYVRQLLPPNRRLEKHIGLLTTLFGPLDTVINKANEYIYNAQFDQYGGQCGVLEFVLRNYVHPNIKVLDADGVRVDFRVLVPAGLTPAQSGEVIRLLERHRLLSKRYEITVEPDWTSGGVAPDRLAWVQAPAIVTGLQLTYSVNRSGVFLTRIYRSDTGAELENRSLEHIIDATRTVQLPGAGLWRIEVGVLSATVDATVPTETTTTPPWITWLGYTWDTTNRESSIWLDATVDCELKVEPVDGAPVSGITWNSLPWNNTGWVAGTTDWASPHSEVFRLNPVGASGLRPGVEYKFSVRRTATPNPVYVFRFTMPAAGTSAITAIPLSTGQTGTACGFGPFVYSINFFDQSKVGWTMDAQEVYRLRAHLKRVSDGAILYSQEIELASNQVQWIYPTPVAAGTYQLGTEGASCDSPIYWSTLFTIAAQSGGNPSTPGTVTPYPPSNGTLAPKLAAFGYPGHINMQCTGSSENWTLSDTAEISVPSGFEIRYYINSGEEVITGNNPLVNYLWQSDNPISFQKLIVKQGVTDLYEWRPDGVLGQAMSQNNSVAHCTFMFNKF